jgi:predicted RNase H-like HicB family nuclease
MHMLIYAIVEASTSEEALARGKAAFDRLVGAHPDARPVFDYYVTFDEQTSEVAGPARWGQRPAAAPADSTAGRDLIEAGWETTATAFEENLQRVKDALEAYSDAEIRRNEDLTRHAFYEVGAYRGPTVALYDEAANGIRSREHLDRLLEECEEPWVVPADVHF